MHSVLEELHASIHFWPWAVEVNSESKSLTEKTVEFPFYGSPVVTLSDKALLFLSSRMERFKTLGCSYDSGYVVHETPHGVLTGNTKTKQLKVRVAQKTFDINFVANGASKRYLDPSEGSQQTTDSPIARTVLAWSQVFDDLIYKIAGDGREQSSFAEISWQEILEYFKQIEAEIREPRMAVIVRIAQKMRNKLPEAVASARKILLRHRQLVPLHKLQETDVACLRWYSRQPGENTVEKAGNKQRLLAVVRRESFNTLENQVLKDFALRCRREAARYVQSEIRNPMQKRSSRALTVQGYKRICEMALMEPFFEQIPSLSPGFNPNYVLQNDLRYKEIWYWYCKLLRREHEEDSLWDWQPRTWADVSRLLVCSALEWSRQEKKQIQGNLIDPLVESKVKIRMEQEAGCRIRSESLPGPFLVNRNENEHGSSRMVLEIVHPDLALKHPITNDLGRLGAHLTLVVHPVDGNIKRKKVLVIWAVNTAGSTQKMDFDTILNSAQNALKQHYLILSRRRPEFPDLKGLILTNTLQVDKDLQERKSENIHLLEIGADPRMWRSSIPKLAEKILGLL